MRRALWSGMIACFLFLSACGGGNSAVTVATEGEVQEIVQNFYNELSKMEQEGKTALEAFNEALAAYSDGNSTDKQFEKSITKFQKASADISEQAHDVKVSARLPEDIRKLLKESKIAFESAYSLKDQAAQGAASPEVSAEEFNDLNQQAEVAMLYGISKLNEARVACGLVDETADPQEE